MFENPRRGRQARNVTTNAPKILDLKSPSEQIFSRKLPLGAPEYLWPSLPKKRETKESDITKNVRNDMVLSVARLECHTEFTEF